VLAFRRGGVITRGAWGHRRRRVPGRATGVRTRTGL